MMVLNAAKCPAELDVPGWRLQPLKGDMADHWAIKVNGNWRLTFTFDGEDAALVYYQDYH
jgi:proteic killer suppression protein